MLTTCISAAVLAVLPPSPQVQQAVGRVSAEECSRSIRTLAGFGTRHALSDTASSTCGIGAARTWIRNELASHEHLKVAFEEFQSPKLPRLPDGATLVNVVATLPGHLRSAARRVVYVVGHYDSINGDVMNSTADAPGANDDASGTTVVLECARVASALELDATVVFLASCAEEQGLVGARYHAQALAAAKAYDQVYVLNNDIVGDPSVPFVTAPGMPAQDSHTFVRVFSESFPRGASAEEMARIRMEGLESDSPSRELARFVSYVARAEALALQPKLIFRQDRFLRGGDHSAFNEAGFTAVRFSVPAEDYSRQHATVTERNGKPYGDTPDFVDPAYIARVAQLNLASLIHLANAPSTPTHVRLLTKQLTTTTSIKWDPSPETDVAGYEIVLRGTTSPDWEVVIDAGSTTEHVLDVSKDNYLFGVRAYDQDGYRSVVTAAVSSKE